MFECLYGNVSVGANTLASMMQAWLVVKCGVADLDVCLLSRVRCGSRTETKGAKTTHRRLCNRGISQHRAANHSFHLLSNHKKRIHPYFSFSLWFLFQYDFAKSLVIFEIPESKCIRSYISGDIGIQWYADIMWS